MRRTSSHGAPGTGGAVVSERGQMAVELAVVTPVVLLMLVIVFDMLVFMGECARFDHIVPQQVLAHATSSSAESAEIGARTAAIQSSLDAEFAKNGSSVSVDCSDADVLLASMTSYRCVFRFAPWPLSLSSAPPCIEHECRIVVDPYTPGELL